MLRTGCKWHTSNLHPQTRTFGFNFLIEIANVQGLFGENLYCILLLVVFFPDHNIFKVYYKQLLGYEVVS